MSKHDAEEIKNAIIDRYLTKTKTSNLYHQKALEFLPSGSSRTSTHYLPYPVYMEGGEGCFLTDADGNTYLDVHNNYTSLIHGHAHPQVVKEVAAVLSKGVIRGAPTSTIIRHAEMLRKRVESLELLRYCNSGTEATMFAIRCARAFSGKEIIIKMDGGYHGTHDMVEINVSSDPTTDVPVRRLEGRGVPSQILETVVIVPFNDLAAIEEAFNKNKDRVAAVIVEPMMNAAGEIPPLPDYLKGLRKLCDQYKVLLIFDEVVTFRLSEGGMQQIEGIRADLTTLGKIIGGGFPVGAFGAGRTLCPSTIPVSRIL